MSLRRHSASACLPRQESQRLCISLALPRASNLGLGCPIFAQLFRANVGPCAALCESLRPSRRRLPLVASVIFSSPSNSASPSTTASCNSQLQLDAFLGSVDYRGLMLDLSPFRINTSEISQILRSVDYEGLILDLSPFRINTSKNTQNYRIALIQNDFKSPTINTSKTKDLKSPRINTSKNKDLKSLIINTSKKKGRGEGSPEIVNYSFPSPSTKPCALCALCGSCTASVFPSADAGFWTSTFRGRQRNIKMDLPAAASSQPSICAGITLAGQNAGREWSGRWESNPRPKLGKLLYCHCTTPARSVPKATIARPRSQDVLFTAIGRVRTTGRESHPPSSGTRFM